MPAETDDGNAIVVLALHGIELNDELGQGFNLTPDILITNNFREVKKHLHHDFETAVGKLEWHSLEHAKAIIYSKGKLLLQNGQGVEKEALNVFLHLIGVILDAFWLVKDNAVNFELGFMQVERDQSTLFHSNFLAAIFSSASGLRLTTQFSRHDLRRASQLFRESLGRLSSPNIFMDCEEAKGHDAPRLGSQRSVPRLTRVAYFLSGARMMSDLGSKIVDYITALEVLFSTDSTELSHKVAHRVAIFLGSSHDQKLHIFSAVKKAYSIRSKVVHGDVLSKENVEHIAEISQQIDEILRKVLLKIFASPQLAEIFEGKKDNLEAYFLKSSFE